jgi:MFS family permease
MQDTREARKRAFLVLAILVIVNTVNYMDRNVINILLPRIKDHMLLSDTALGLLGGAAFTLFYALAALPIGWAVDRFPRRIILVTGLLVWSMATFASGAAATFVLLFAARALTGSGEATAHPAGVSLIGDLFSARRRTIAIAIFQAGVAIGGGIGVIVGGHLTVMFDWRVTLMAFALAGALLAPLVILLPEPVRGAADRIGPGGRATTTPRYGDRLLKFARIPTLVVHYAATILIMFALQGYVVWMPSFLERHRGFDLEQVSNLAGAATLVGGIVGGVLGGWLADWLQARDRRGRLFLQTAAALLAAPCMIATVYVEDGLVIVAGLFAVMILLVVMFPILSAIIVDLVDPGDTGTAMSILLMAQTGVGFSLGPLVVGRVSDVTGSLSLGLLAPPVALVLVVALGLLGLATVRRDIEARQQRTASLT